jgi:outer membrane protein assembly factor BamB
MKFLKFYKFSFWLIALALLGWITPTSKAAMLVTSNRTDSILRYNDETGEFIDTFVPTNANGLNGLSGMTIGPDGLLYVISIRTDSVLRYNPHTGEYIDTFVRDKTLEFAEDLTFGPDGNFYLSSSSLQQNINRIVRYDGKTGAFIDNFVAPGSGGIFGPVGIGFGGDRNFYVGSVFKGEIVRYNGKTGSFIDTFIKGNKGDRFADFTFAADGNLYIANAGNNSVDRYNASTGKFIDNFVESGSGGLNLPVEAVFGTDGNLYVNSFETDRILRYNGKTGAFIDTFVSPNSGGLDGPTSIVFVKDVPESSYGVPILVFVLVSGLLGLRDRKKGV